MCDIGCFPTSNSFNPYAPVDTIDCVILPQSLTKYDRPLFIVCDHRAKSVGCPLSQRSHRPDPCSPHPWLLTSRIGTPFALFQLLVLLPQEPFVHARTQRCFEDRDRQRAFALLDGPIGQDDNPFPLPGAHVPG